MVRFLMVSGTLLATATACGPHAAYRPLVPVPSVEAQRIRGFFTDVAYRGEDAIVSFRLAEPSSVILLERDPYGSYALLDSASAPRSFAAGNHSVSVKRHLGLGTPPREVQECSSYYISVPAGWGDQSELQEALTCRPIPQTAVSPRCGEMTACDHLVIAIIPDRPVSVDLVREAARRMQDSVYVGAWEQIAEWFQDQRSVSDFERLAQLAPDSTRWAVARIALR